MEKVLYKYYVPSKGITMFVRANPKVSLKGVAVLIGEKINKLYKEKIWVQSNDIVVEQASKPKSYCKIVKHIREYELHYINHAVLVESDKEPNAGEIAINVGYHPAGYGMYNETIEKLYQDQYMVRWGSGDKC